MKITIIGTGYVGLVTSAILAQLEHQVIGLDIDEEKVKQLRKGKITIHEPELGKLITQGRKNNRLRFTTDYSEALKEAEVVFICVGTPPQQDGSYDLKFVYAATKSIAENLKHYAVIVIKSTVPPSTTKKVKQILKESTDVKHDIASCPEFLREGSAVADAFHPARIVIGTETVKAKKILLKVHRKIKAPVLETTPQSAQLIKYASNAFLATKVSFINSIAILCDKINVDVKEVEAGLGMDPRIGPSFLKAGLGYGGSCFPKDTWALISYAQKLGYDFDFLKQVDQVNKKQIDYFISKIKTIYNQQLKGKTLTILGLTFKPNTDDLREARSIPLIKKLQQLGVTIHAYDPVAVDKAKSLLPKVKFFNDPYSALADSDGLVLVTEWPEFADLDFKRLNKLMKQKIVIDGRNLYNPSKLKSLGFKYIGIGRQ